MRHTRPQFSEALKNVNPCQHSMRRSWLRCRSKLKEQNDVDVACHIKAESGNVSRATLKVRPRRTTQGMVNTAHPNKHLLRAWTLLNLQLACVVA